MSPLPTEYKYGIPTNITTHYICCWMGRRCWFISRAAAPEEPVDFRHILTPAGSTRAYNGLHLIYRVLQLIWETQRLTARRTLLAWESDRWPYVHQHLLSIIEQQLFEHTRPFFILLFCSSLVVFIPRDIFRYWVEMEALKLLGYC